MQKRIQEHNRSIIFEHISAICGYVLFICFFFEKMLLKIALQEEPKSDIINKLMYNGGNVGCSREGVTWHRRIRTRPM